MLWTVCVYSPTHHGHFERKFNATRTNPIYSGGLIMNFESMNQELFSKKDIWLVPYKGIQASLRFWIPCCWFRIPGIGFLIFGKWNLDSGFQSLVGPGFLEQYSIFQSPGFQIPRGKKFEESGSPYMGRIVIFSVFYRYSATSCVKPHWLVRKQSKSVQSIMWHSQQNRKRCPNQLLPDYSGVYQNTQPSADLWTAGIYHGITEDHSVVGRVVAWLTHADSPWCYTKTTATGGRDKSSQQ